MQFKLKQLFKRNFVLATTVVALSATAAAQTAPITVTWVMGKNGAQPIGSKSMKYSSSFIVKNVSESVLNGNWDLYYNAFDRSPQVIGEDQQFVITKFRPGYYVLSPNEKFKPLAPGDSVVVDFLSNLWFNNDGYRPDGGQFIYRDGNDKVLQVDIHVPLYENPQQWIAPGREADFYPTGENMYWLNSLLNPSIKAETSPFDIVPKPKSVSTKHGTTTLSGTMTVSGKGRACEYLKERLAANHIKTGKSSTSVTFKTIKVNEHGDEYYKLSIANGKITISAPTETGALNGAKTLAAIIEREGVNATIPNAEIEDYPDLQHRGMMLDVSRNFTKYENMKRFIDAIAMYKINVFHFHITDDEAWRLEIPGLPELTEVGARKGFTRDESEFLMQTYAGNGDPNDLSTSANGYFTRDQFIDIIKFAYSRGIEVIPEIESPGHARAAIVAMKARYNRYKDSDKAKAEEYMVWDNDDTSKYTSAQGYHDNVLNFAQEGTYRFMDKVIGEIVAMFKEAKVPLRTIHIGGDEVANGAWTGSPVVKEFMKKHHLTSLKMGSEYFIDRVSKMVADRGIGVGGWQEVAMHHSAEYNSQVAPRFNLINAWSTLGRSDTIPYSIANNGFPVVLSNVTNLYFDMIYCWHPQEYGLNWGGAVDEFSAWGVLPYNSYRSARYSSSGKALDFRNADKGKIKLNDKRNIRGIQAQLFAETIRNFDMVTKYVFPRLIGLSERSWNAEPVWATDNDDVRYNAERAQFNLNVARELPRLASRGLNFHLGQPGVKIENGMIYINAQYPDEEVRYTTDGSEPNEDSPIWTAPIRTNAKTVKAKSFYCGRSSNTSTFTR